MDLTKQFFKYVSQNIFGLLGTSCYILADTYFIAQAAGTDGVTLLILCLPIYNFIFAIGSRHIIRVHQRGVAVIELCRKFFPLPAQYLQKTVADISKRIAVFRVLCAAVKATRYILCIAFQPQKSFFYRLVYFHLVFPVSFSVYRTLTARGTPCCRNLPSYDAPILGVL